MNEKNSTPYAALHGLRQELKERYDMLSDHIERMNGQLAELSTIMCIIDESAERWKSIYDA